MTRTGQKKEGTMKKGSIDPVRDEKQTTARVMPLPKSVLSKISKKRTEAICNLIPEKIRKGFSTLRFRHIGPHSISLEDLLLDETIAPEDIEQWILEDQKKQEQRTLTQKARKVRNDPSALCGISSPAFFKDE